MLEPQDRRLFLESLRPPDGYVLDRALGTTFSLDLLALLTAPLAFTMFDWEDEQGRPKADPLALLEALRRHADHMAVFCQAGEIKVPPHDQLLLSYLESSIIEAGAKHPNGVFHPKIWILRFTAPGKPVAYRLVSLSRNLTFDRSWDTIVALDGEVMERKNAFAGNHPLGDFVKALPGLALRTVPRHAQAIVTLFQDELRRVGFDIPEPFDEFSFCPLGHDGKDAWPFDRVQRALVVAPFLSDGFLSRLSASGEQHILVSRLDSLQALEDKTRAGFKTLYRLKEGTEGDGEGADDLSTLSGLHAKVFVIDDGWNASVLVGSANATDSAFRHNVEFLIELRGKKSKCGVEAMLGTDPGQMSLSSLLEEVQIAESTPHDAVQEALDTLFLEARRRICAASLTFEVRPSPSDSYDVHLVRPGPLQLADGVVARCWPVTLHRSAARELTAEEVAFPGLTFEALTSFLAIELEASIDDSRVATCPFVLNLPLVGAPSDRRERLLHSLLKDRDQVMRLLLLLLSEGGMDAAALLEPPKDGASGVWGAYGQSHLFESLMKALARSPHKLDDVASFFADLSRSEQTRGLLPEGFEAIWSPIWEARQRLSAGDSNGKA